MINSIDHVKMKQCKDLYDGCSVPGVLQSLSANLKKYHDVFNPACLKHDICYACVSYEYLFISILENRRYVIISTGETGEGV